MRTDRAKVFAVSRTGSRLSVSRRKIASMWSVRAGATGLVAASSIFVGVFVYGSGQSPDPGSGGVFAATHPSLAVDSQGTGSARGLLEELAAHAAGMTSGGTTGPYDYVKVQEWTLSTAVQHEQSTSVILPKLHESWLAADGSGRERALSGAAEPVGVPSAGTAYEAARTGSDQISDIRYPPVR